jgi:hypothetical protein
MKTRGGNPLYVEFFDIFYKEMEDELMEFKKKYRKKANEYFSREKVSDCLNELRQKAEKTQG